MSTPTKDRTKRFVIDAHQSLPYDAARVWSAIADPVAYFTWNPAATLTDPLPDLAHEMKLTIDSPLLGRTTYHHRIDPDTRTVLHEVGLRMRFLALGQEIHRWRVTERDDGQPGCMLHQTMEVELNTFVSRLLAGSLQKQFQKVFDQNFKLVDAWLESVPTLVDERLPLFSRIQRAIHAHS